MLNSYTKVPSLWIDLKRGVLVEARVISALVLREIHTINGNSKLGYLWVLIQSVFSIGVFWGMRQFMGAGQAPHGMNMAMFLAIGMGVWGIFSNTVSRCMSAVSGNRALLTFPQVTELDVMIARTLVVSATQILVTVIIIVVSAVLLDYRIIIGNFPLLLMLLCCVPLMSFGIGLIITSITVFVPVLEKIVPMVLRVMFFVSGVFFSLSAFNSTVAEYLLLNPVMQSIELFRESLHEPYEIQGLNFGYILIMTISSCAIGGLLERYVRSRRSEQ